VVLTVLRLMGASTFKPQYSFTNQDQHDRNDMRWTMSPYCSVDIEKIPADFIVLIAWPYAAPAMLDSKLSFLKC
jgi:hypothetical protein